MKTLYIPLNKYRLIRNNITISSVMHYCSQHCQPVPSPVDKLPIEKTGEAPVWYLHTLIWLSSGVQSICDTKKCMAATVNKF